MKNKIKVKTCKVVLLPSTSGKIYKELINYTDDGQIIKNDNLYMDEILTTYGGVDHFQLYFFSNKKIKQVKAGDWFYDEKNKKIIQSYVDLNESDPFAHGVGGGYFFCCKKIVATTDPKLVTIIKIDNYEKILNVPYPQPTDEWIEQYCKNPVNEVRIEYKEYFQDELEGGEFVLRSCGYFIKLSKDNKINII